MTLTSPRGAGLDFGTTNSSLAVIDHEGGTHLASFGNRHERSHTFRSVLYFRTAKRASERGVWAGPDAIEQYLAAQHKGRFIQSLKSYLPDAGFDGTAINGQRYSLEQLISLIIRNLVAAAAETFGPLPQPLFVGRPVHFSASRQQKDDEFALTRLKKSLDLAGVKETVFELEPVAAAYAYQQRIDRPAVVLIGDFGGGTSDFCVLSLYPGPVAKHRPEVLATNGTAIGGDTFDKQLIRRVVAPGLGQGSDYVSPPDKVLPVPDWPYAKLERWHYLSFLKASPALEMLKRIRMTAREPQRIQAFLNLVKQDLGYELHQQVQRLKLALSARDSVDFEFDVEPVSMRETVGREGFERWIAEETHQIAECVDGMLRTSGIPPGRIDRVFLTGGSSFVPAIRRLFVERFGMEKITGGSELTSVAEGLALRSAAEWTGRA